jgi:hypothetical protein
MSCNTSNQSNALLGRSSKGAQQIHSKGATVRTKKCLEKTTTGDKTFPEISL